MDAFVEFLAFLVPSHVCHHQTFLALSQSGSPTETDRQKPSLHFPVKTVLRSLQFFFFHSQPFSGQPTEVGCELFIRSFGSISEKTMVRRTTLYAVNENLQSSRITPLQLKSHSPYISSMRKQGDLQRYHVSLLRQHSI